MLLFFGIAFPLFAVFGAYLLRVAWHRGNASQKWPTTKGLVIASKTEYDGDHYSPKVRYRYQVNSKILEGDTVTYRGFSTDRDTVEAYVKKYHEDATVSVYYDPDAPANSVLEPGVDKKAYIAGLVVLLSLFWTGIGLLLFALLSRV
jgi:hypothetical protein